MDLIIPLYYILNRSLPRDHSALVRDFLSITPINCVISARATDSDLALEFSQHFILASSEEAAVSLSAYVAEESGQSVLLLGSVDGLEAWIKDSQGEHQCLSKQTLQSLGIDDSTQKKPSSEKERNFSL